MKKNNSSFWIFIFLSIILLGCSIIDDDVNESFDVKLILNELKLEDIDGTFSGSSTPDDNLLPSEIRIEDEVFEYTYDSDSNVIKVSRTAPGISEMIEYAYQSNLLTELKWEVSDEYTRTDQIYRIGNRIDSIGIQVDSLNGNESVSFIKIYESSSYDNQPATYEISPYDSDFEIIPFEDFFNGSIDFNDSATINNPNFLNASVMIGLSIFEEDINTQIITPVLYDFGGDFFVQINSSSLSISSNKNFSSYPRDLNIYVISNVTAVTYEFSPFFLVPSLFEDWEFYSAIFYTDWLTIDNVELNGVQSNEVQLTIDYIYQ